MKDCFKVEQNKLYIQDQPINNLDYFAKLCMQILANTIEDDIYIIIGDSVEHINSAYIGVLMSCAMLSNQMEKKLHISCNNHIKKLINILGGHNLMNFIDDF